MNEEMVDVWYVEDGEIHRGKAYKPYLEDQRRLASRMNFGTWAVTIFEGEREKMVHSHKIREEHLSKEKEEKVLKELASYRALKEKNDSLRAQIEQNEKIMKDLEGEVGK